MVEKTFGVPKKNITKLNLPISSQQMAEINTQVLHISTSFFWKNTYEIVLTSSMVRGFLESMFQVDFPRVETPRRRHDS